MSNPKAAGCENAAPGVSPNVPSRGCEMSPDVPGCPPMSPMAPPAKTNPNPPQQQLKPLQLAAARAFAKGGRTLAIADALRISRRTLSRWQRLPAFREETLRVHRTLSQPPARPAPSPQLQPTERQFLDQVYTSAMKRFMQL